MLCDGCKRKDASIVLHMMTNGQVATRSLCEDCAQKAHREMSQAFATMGMRIEGLGNMLKEAQEEKVSIPRMMCSSCRTAYEDIGRDTVFGCPRCYDAFHEQVLAYLSNVRPTPQPAEETTEGEVVLPAPTVETLKASLQDAIKMEDYEQAAALRDQLQKLADGAGESTVPPEEEPHA